MRRTNISLVLFVAIAMTAGLVAVSAQGDKVAFPATYASGVRYWVQDRPDATNPANSQVREYYTSAAAIGAAKKGQPMPNGTVITVVQYAVQLDAQGKPAMGPSGRMVKSSEIRGYAAMEKRTGWGAQYAADKRNGEWEYQAFTADRAVNAKADLNTCFSCHKKLESSDFVFSLDQMKAAR